MPSVAAGLVRGGRPRLVRRGRHARRPRRRARGGRRHPVPDGLDHQDLRRGGRAPPARRRSLSTSPTASAPTSPASRLQAGRHRLRAAPHPQRRDPGRDRRPVVGADARWRLGPRSAGFAVSGDASAPGAGSTTPTSGFGRARRGRRGAPRPAGRSRPRGRPRTARHDPHHPPPAGRAARGLAVHPCADVLLPEPEHDAGAMAPPGQLWATLPDLARCAAFLIGDDRRGAVLPTPSRRCPSRSRGGQPGQAGPAPTAWAGRSGGSRAPLGRPRRVDAGLPRRLCGCASTTRARVTASWSWRTRRRPRCCGRCWTDLLGGPGRARAGGAGAVGGRRGHAALLEPPGRGTGDRR